jgi:hypothetical protein
MGSRHSLGFAAAALLATAGAGIEQGWSCVSWGLFGSGVLVLALAFADRLPALHRLPPPWGAVRPPDVECHIEGRSDLRFEMQPGSGPDTALLAVGFSHDNRHRITGFDLNVYVVGSTRIQRVTQDGKRVSSGAMQVADGPYWTEGDLRLGRRLPMWFKVELPEPGEYQIVVVMNSPEFYERDGIDLQRPEDVLVASRVGENIDNA